jgi:hypothetical protein
MNEEGLMASQLLCDDDLAAILPSAICFVHRHWSLLLMDPYCYVIQTGVLRIVDQIISPICKPLTSNLFYRSSQQVANEKLMQL